MLLNQKIVKFSPGIAVNVRDYVNYNNCLTSVFTKRSSDNLICHPYIIKGSLFDVRTTSNSKSKQDMFFEQFINLLINQSQYPGASVRCKPDKRTTKGNGGVKLEDLNLDMLRQKLIKDGYGSLVGEGLSNPAIPMLSQAVSNENLQTKTKSVVENYRFDPSSNDERRRSLREQTPMNADPSRSQLRLDIEIQIANKESVDE